MGFSASTYGALLSKLRSETAGEISADEVKKLVEEYLSENPVPEGSYFKSLEEAEAAALTAVPMGDNSSSYHFGQKILVDDGENITWYTIQRSGELVSDGSLTNGTTISVLVDGEEYPVANMSEPEATGEDNTYSMEII